MKAALAKTHIDRDRDLAEADAAPERAEAPAAPADASRGRAALTAVPSVAEDEDAEDFWENVPI